MSAIIENTAYRLRVRSDNGRILTAQRAYLSQGHHPDRKEILPEHALDSFRVDGQRSSHVIPRHPVRTAYQGRAAAGHIKTPRF